MGSNLKEPLLVLHLLTVAARLEIHIGHSAQAVWLCSLVLGNPQAEAALQQEAKSLLAELHDLSAAAGSETPNENQTILPTFEALLAEIEHDRG